MISPSNALYDRRTKADTYRAMGVRELWLVDPVAKEVEVRSFAGDNVMHKSGEVLRSEVLPGITIAVADLFS